VVKSCIVVHHWGFDTSSFTPKQLFSSMNNIAKEKHSYHYVIFDSGLITCINPINKLVGHAANQKLSGDDDRFNISGIGVSFAGLYINHLPPPDALFAFHCLKKSLDDSLVTNLKILLHKDISFTDCPGMIKVSDLSDPKYLNFIAMSTKNNPVVKCFNNQAFINLRSLQQMKLIKNIAFVANSKYLFIK